MTKGKLLDLVSQVARFRLLSLRTEETYRNWAESKALGQGPNFSSSLRLLRDLGVSAVNNWFKYTHRRDAENAEVAQRISIRTLASANEKLGVRWNMWVT